MPYDIFHNIFLRRKRIAGLLLSEKALHKKDIIALNLELYAASQAVSSAQKHLISEQINLAKQEIQLGRKKAALKYLGAIERLLKQL